MLLCSSHHPWSSHEWMKRFLQAGSMRAAERLVFSRGSGYARLQSTVFHFPPIQIYRKMHGKGQPSPRTCADLEDELQCKLHFAPNSTRAVNYSKIRVVIIRGFHSGPKIRVVEEVEKLRSELEVGSFSCLEFLED